MESFSNITVRRKKHKVHSDFSHRQNNCAINEEEKLRKKRKRSNHYTIDPSTEDQNDYISYEKYPSVVTDPSSRLHSVVPCLGGDSYDQIVNVKEKRMSTDSIDLRQHGEQTLKNKGWKSQNTEEGIEFVKVIRSNINRTNHIQECDVQGPNVKKRDLQTAKSAEAIHHENNSRKEFYVDNILDYPKKKHKKVDSSDLEIANSETGSLSKQKFCEVNSDSGIDVQKKLKFKKNNKTGYNKSKISETTAAVSSPLVKSKNTRGFKNDVELTDMYLNKNGSCIDPNIKTNSLIISSKIDHLCHVDGKGSAVNTTEDKHEELLQSRKCDQSTEGCLEKKDITLLHETPTNNSDSVEESCSRKETLHKVESHLYLNKSENLVQFASDSRSHHSGKGKKKKHKNKFEKSNIFAHEVYEFESASSDFPNKKNKKKKRTNDRSEKIKFLQEDKNHSSADHKDHSFTKKKKKKNDKLWESEQGITECFTKHYDDKIKKKKKYKSELDEVKDKFVTQAVEKFSPECAEHTDKSDHVNRLANEMLKSSESKADISQKKFLNILHDQKNQLHTVCRKTIHDKDLENLKTALLSSALKNIRYKKSKSSDINVHCKESIDSVNKNAIKGTNQLSNNKERKHSEEKTSKGKYIYKSAYNLNKKSSDTQNNVDEIRQALITAASERIKQNEQKQRHKVSLLVDCSEHEVILKNKRKSKIQKNVKKKNKTDDVESMRYFLMSAALAKLNGSNVINKTVNIHNKNGKAES